MTLLADNLRRLLARQGLSVNELVTRSQLDPRTITGLLRGQAMTPRSRTLRQLADGLGVSVDELFCDAALLQRRQFDRQTNPAVDSLMAEHPELFVEWTADDFDELYSQFGAGGALTGQGARQLAERINQKREVLRRVALILETAEADTLTALVDVLYRKVSVV